MSNNEQPIIILADNGSTKASATLQLRSIAQQLSERTSQNIHPVSLQHADVIAADELGGVKASVLSEFLRDQLQQGQREFIIVPLFFGNSRALTKFIPDLQAELEGSFGQFEIQIMGALYAPSHSVLGSDTALPDIIYDHVQQTAQANSLSLTNIVLVDHGSPSPKITAVRNGVAKEVQARLGGGVQLEQAVMERREGKQYDFNGELLKDWLIAKAEQGETSAIVTLLFSLPGRHAGEGGDIVTICDSVMQRYPNFKIGISPLVGDHPLLLDILVDRLNVIQES
ncbi:MAG: CbiX/SirB N-terminal domain-containing protein [Cocleimonas sp.]